jgi:hypothetical protein
MIVKVLRFSHEATSTQTIRLKATTNKNFVLQNLNENQDFLLQIVLNLFFQE